MSLHDFVRQHDVENVQRVLKKDKHAINKRDVYGQTPLHLASYYAFPDIVALLLARHADVKAVDKNGWSALHSAANSGEYGISKMLIEKGADVNQVTQTGTSPLHYMVQHNCEGDSALATSVLEMMVEKGAQIDIQTNYGETPLFQACMRGRVENVAFLLAQGADVNKQAKSGETSLHFAARIGNLEVIELLLKAGADPDISGSFGTCFDVAKMANHEQAIELFNKANAARGKKPKSDKVSRKIKRRSMGPGRKITDATLKSVSDSKHPGYGIAFGIKRGPCETTSCGCKAYEPEDAERGGPCKECGHFPVKHKNLGKVQLEDSEEDSSVASGGPSSPLSTPPTASTAVAASETAAESTESVDKEPEVDPSAKLLLAQGASNIAGHELIFGDELGAGTSAKVYKGLYRGQEVAIKVLKSVLDVKEMDNFKKELDIMRQLQSEYVVRFWGTCVDPHICLVMDFCSRGSLYHVLQQKTANVNWPSAFMLAEGMMRGILALHSWKPAIVHRDLKSLNLLVDEQWNVKVCDFGLSRFTDGGNMSTLGKLRGTFAYCAPEVYFGARFSPKSDIYSVGVVLWEIMMRTLTGEYARPYAEYKHLVFDFQIIIQTAKKGLRPTIPSQCPPEFARLIRRCWDGEADNRPECGEVLAELDNLSNMYKANSTPWDTVRVLQPDIDMSCSFADIRIRAKAASAENLSAGSTRNSNGATKENSSQQAQESAPITAEKANSTPPDSPEIQKSKNRKEREVDDDQRSSTPPPAEGRHKKKTKKTKDKDASASGGTNKEKRRSVKFKKDALADPTASPTTKDKKPKKGSRIV